MYLLAEQTQPVITGPTSLELGDEATWTCVTDIVTMDSLGQFELTFTSSPELSIEIVRDKSDAQLEVSKQPPR